MIPDKLWTWRLIIMSTSKQKPTWEKRSTPFSFRRCAGGDGWQELLQWNETDRATMNFANKEGNVLVPNLKKTQFLFIHTKAERTRGIGNFNWEWRDKTHLSKSYKSPSRGFYGGLDLAAEYENLGGFLCPFIHLLFGGLHGAAWTLTCCHLAKRWVKWIKIMLK